MSKELLPCGHLVPLTPGRFCKFSRRKKFTFLFEMMMMVLKVVHISVPAEDLPNATWTLIKVLGMEKLLVKKFAFYCGSVNTNSEFAWVMLASTLKGDKEVPKHNYIKLVKDLNSIGGIVWDMACVDFPEPVIIQNPQVRTYQSTGASSGMDIWIFYV